MYTMYTVSPIISISIDCINSVCHAMLTYPHSLPFLILLMSTMSTMSYPCINHVSSVCSISVLCTHLCSIPHSTLRYVISCHVILYHVYSNSSPSLSQLHLHPYTLHLHCTLYQHRLYQFGGGGSKVRCLYAPYVRKDSPHPNREGRLTLKVRL
jgi:hypothetical protein